ncbi:hypothetical protein FGO68_gene2743 [Halteria grandinella]|uniref:Uncharacterized protein n=1 Tax=Halteria grandinella TaxID=5974 RepID=A0A8J8SXS6_HALGN|nr:hypothetical protein FGO68_gene2743 [Halteria grandinella]
MPNTPCVEQIVQGKNDQVLLRIPQPSSQLQEEISRTRGLATDHDNAALAEISTRGANIIKVAADSKPSKEFTPQEGIERIKRQKKRELITTADNKQ